MIENYNELLKLQYRNIVRAAVDYMLHEFSDIETQERNQVIADTFLEYGRENGFTDRTSLDKEWIRKRLYRPDLCADFPMWATKSALMYLIDKHDWMPKNDEELFGCIGLCIRIFGGNNPTHDEIIIHLPERFKSDRGFELLNECLETVKQQQANFGGRHE